MDTVTLADSSCGQVLCSLDDIPDGSAIAVVAGEDSVIVLRRGDEVRAYLNVCPHAGRQLDYAPGKFLLKNDTLICAVHGATFNRDDGLCIAGPCRGEHLRALPVSVAHDKVCLG